MKKNFYFYTLTTLLSFTFLTGCNKNNTNTNEKVNPNNEQQTKKEFNFISESYLPKVNKKYYEETKDLKTNEIIKEVDGKPIFNYYKRENNSLVKLDNQNYASYQYYETEKGLFIKEGSHMYRGETKMKILSYPIEIGTKWTNKGPLTKVTSEIVSVDEKLNINGKTYNNLVKVKLSFFENGDEYNGGYMLFGKGLGRIQYKNQYDELLTVKKIENMKNKENKIKKGHKKLSQQTRDLPRETGIKTTFNTFQTASEYYLKNFKENNKDVKLDIQEFNDLLDKNLQFEGSNPNSLISKQKNPWEKPYKIELNQSEGKIVFKTFTDFGTSFVLATYYNKGQVESCTKGFRQNIRHQLTFEDGQECGQKLRSN